METIWLLRCILMTWKGEKHRHSASRRGIRTIKLAAKGLSDQTPDFQGYIKSVNMKELHEKVREYAYQLNVKPEELEIRVQVWGHWDAAYPVLHLVNLTREESYNLTERKTIHTLDEMDEFVEELAHTMNG